MNNTYLRRYLPLLIICLIPLYVYAGSKTTKNIKLGKGKKPLLVLCDDWLPYQGLNKKGQADGLNVEIIKAVARTEKLDIKIEVMSWQKAQFMIRQRKGDILLGASITAERKKWGLFSLPFNSYRRVIFSPKTKPINSVKEMFGKKVAVQKNSAAQEQLRKYRGKVKLLALKDDLSAFIQVFNEKKGDAVATDHLFGLYTLNKIGMKKQAIIGEEILETVPYSMLVNKKNAALVKILNRGLKKIIANKKLDKIINKWSK